MDFAFFAFSLSVVVEDMMARALRRGVGWPGWSSITNFSWSGWWGVKNFSHRLVECQKIWFKRHNISVSGWPSVKNFGPRLVWHQNFLSSGRLRITKFALNLNLLRAPPPNLCGAMPRIFAVPLDNCRAAAWGHKHCWRARPAAPERGCAEGK